MMLTLAEVAAAAGAQLNGDGAARVLGVATLASAAPAQVSFFTHPRYREQLARTRAAAVILSADHAALCPVATLVSANPPLALARVAALFTPAVARPGGIHLSAWVSERAELAPDAWVGPHSVVSAGAHIASGAYIGPGCVLEEDVYLGAGSHLVARVTLCRGVRLGQRVLVHPGAVIGSDGFGLANDAGRWVKIPQLGSVVIGDEVEIGANTTIDRGALDDTVLEEGVKLDNQVQVGHNVRIGAHTAVAGCVGIAGSARIGRYCAIGGGAGIGGHIDIVDHVQITAMSMVAKSITEPGVYSSGLPVEPNRVWNKISARLRRIDELARRLTALEKGKT